MSPAPVAAPAPAKRFPRVSGDEPGDQVAISGVIAFSPRERG